MRNYKIGYVTDGEKMGDILLNGMEFEIGINIAFAFLLLDASRDYRGQVEEL